MYFQNITLFSNLLALSGVLASCVDNDLQTRNLAPIVCQKVIEVVKVLQLNEATPFCSSFLNIATQTSTAVTYANNWLINMEQSLSRNSVPRQQ